MPADPPELATNEERAAAVAAREAKGLSQREVGQKVGTSQNVVSLIESGKVESSSFVLPISRLLGISPPQFHESDEQRQWVELGHLLRSKDRRQFQRALALVESMVRDGSEDLVQPDPDQDRK